MRQSKYQQRPARLAIVVPPACGIRVAANPDDREARRDFWLNLRRLRDVRSGPQHQDEQGAAILT